MDTNEPIHSNQDAPKHTQNEKKESAGANELQEAIRLILSERAADQKKGLQQAKKLEHPDTLRPLLQLLIRTATEKNHALHRQVAELLASISHKEFPAILGAAIRDEKPSESRAILISMAWQNPYGCEALIPQMIEEITSENLIIAIEAMTAIEVNIEKLTPEGILMALEQLKEIRRKHLQPHHPALIDELVAELTTYHQQALQEIKEVQIKNDTEEIESQDNEPNQEDKEEQDKEQ